MCYSLVVGNHHLRDPCTESEESPQPKSHEYPTHTHFTKGGKKSPGSAMLNELSSKLGQPYIFSQAQVRYEVNHPVSFQFQDALLLCPMIVLVLQFVTHEFFASPSTASTFITLFHLGHLNVGTEKNNMGGFM